MLDLRVRARSCRSPWAVDPGRGMPHARAPDPASGAAFPRLRPRPYCQRTASRGRPRQGGAAAPVDGGMQDGRRAGSRRLLERLAGQQGAGGVVPVRGKPPPVLGPPKARTPHRTRVAAFPPCRPTPAPRVPLRLAIGVQAAVYRTVRDVHARPALNAPINAGLAGPVPRVQACRRAVLATPRQAAGRPPWRPLDMPAGGSLRGKEQGKSTPHAALVARVGPNARSPAPAAG